MDPRDPQLDQYNPTAQPPISTNAPQTPPMDAEQARVVLRKTLMPLGELSAKEMADLKGAIDRARKRVKLLEESWKILLKEYLPTVKASGDAEILKVNVHFRNVHTKIGQLFYRSPEVQCVPKGPALDTIKDPVTGVPQSGDKVVSIKQAVLNWFLGPDNVNVSRLMDECLFDVLAWAGVAAVKIGYRATLVPVQKPVMGPDPTWQPPPMMPGNVLQLAPQMTPPQVQVGTQTVQVPIYEDWYARRFSPMKLLFNDDLRSTRYDEEATWMGWEFVLPADLAKREFALSDDEAKQVSEDDRVFKHTDTEGIGGHKSLIKGVELWRKASLFRGESQPHPLALDHLVVIDGMPDQPVVYRPSPDQSFDQEGRLTPDSMIGFPIHVITIRDLADSPYPPADSAFTNSQAKELNTNRRQSVKLRDRAIGKQLYDAGHFEDTEIERLKNGEVGEMIAVKPGALAAAGGARGLVDNTAQPVATADDIRTAEIIKQDMQETLGIAGPQLGTPEETVRSATELAQVASSFAGRMEKEQRRAVDAFLGIARKLDALIMRYATETQYVSILGDDGTRDLVAWNNKLISGRYSYDILPDSSWRMDTAQYLRMCLSLYNLAAKDPLFKRPPVLRRIAQFLGWDPRQVVMTAEELAAQQGVQVGQQAQPQHGGKSEPVSPHEQQRTAGPQNQPPGQPSRRM